MAQNEIKTGSSSPKAKILSARLMAVQALYQSMHTGQPLKTAIPEYLTHRTGMVDDDGEQIVEPDGALFKNILEMVHERRGDIEALITANSRKRAAPAPEINPETGEIGPEIRDFEPLLKAVLICGAAEILSNRVDSPIIINDYLNVTHGFYGQGEVNLVNAILDSVVSALKV